MGEKFYCFSRQWRPQKAKALKTVSSLERREKAILWCSSKKKKKKKKKKTKKKTQKTKNRAVDKDWDACILLISEIISKSSRPESGGLVTISDGLWDYCTLTFSLQ